MKYEHSTISEMNKLINQTCFLPHIQRELVWNEKQMYKLFDSMMRGYPIGTFLLWHVEEKKDEIIRLNFIRDFTKKESKNEIDTKPPKQYYWLVLDGQQRLQSLYIALEGSYNGKELFFNLLSEKPQYDDNDDEHEIIYETRFFKNLNNSFSTVEKDKKTGEDKTKLWVKIKSFADLKTTDAISYWDKLFKEYGGLKGNELLLARTNLLYLNNILTTTYPIYYYIEKEEDYEKVLDIFIRTNSGGTKLSKSDLLFSMIKLKWKIPALAEFNNLIKTINQNDNFNFDNDFILKTSLVLIDKEIRYKIENFSKENIGLIEDRWKNIKQSILAVVNLISYDFGITTKKQLTAKNSLIPLIYYTYSKGIKDYQSAKIGIAEDKKLMKKWLYTVSLTNLFSSQTDDLLKICRDAIKENNDSFPLEIIKSKLPPGKSMDVKEDTFNGIRYNDGNDFFVLGLLYPEFNLTSLSSYGKPNIDHIFPVENLQKRYSLELINDISNLQILSDNENKKKSNSTFEEWINGQDESFLTKSYIPNDKNLWKVENYEKFIEERREIMYKKLKEILD